MRLSNVELAFSPVRTVASYLGGLRPCSKQHQVGFRLCSAANIFVDSRDLIYTHCEGKWKTRCDTPGTLACMLGGDGVSNRVTGHCDVRVPHNMLKTLYEEMPLHICKR